MIRHGAILSNVLGQLMYCQESSDAERKDIQIQIDGGIILVRFEAQRFKEFDEVIKTNTIRAINVFWENAQFMVSYDGLAANNRREHTELACMFVPMFKVLDGKLPNTSSS